MLVFFSLGKVQSEFFLGEGGGGFRVQDFFWFLPFGEGERGSHLTKVKATISLLH
jgi:hypothetical protein